MKEYKSFWLIHQKNGRTRQSFGRAFFQKGKWTKTRFTIIILILYSSALFFFDLGKRDLWAPDEPTYAEVAREMWVSKDFILPHLNGEIYAQKPPLLFWLIIFFSLPFGEVTELSARLPSALAGIGCVISTFYLGKRFISNRAGLLAAFILPTSSLFLWMSHRVAFDVVLTFFVTMALIYFLKGFSSETEGRDGRQGRFIPFYVFLALAVLTKGPAGFIPTFIAVLLYLAVQKKLRFLRKMDVWKGTAIFCLIVFGWVVAASLKGGQGYMNEILFKQNVGRFTDPWDHCKPFYYFFVNFPLNFLPWTFFIPSVFIYAFLEKEKMREVLFPFLWFIAFFGFFTISAGKRHIYLLPLYPAASIIMAWFLDNFIGSAMNKKFRWIGCLPGYVLYGVLATLAIILPIFILERFPQEFSASLVISTTVIGGAILALVLLYFKQPFHAFLTTSLFILLTFSLAKELVIPVINEEKSSKHICQKANDIIKPDDKLAIYGFFRPTYLYYTGRNHIEVIGSAEALNSLLTSINRVLIIIQEKHYLMVMNKLTSPAYVLEKDNVGHRKILLVSNKLPK